MGRAPCCDKANVKRGPWSAEEDATLKNYLQKHGTGGNWISLPRKAGLKRCGKSCRLRWLNYLRPDIKHGGFTEEEDDVICSLYSSMGSRWSVIASRLPGRTDNDVKNYWNTKLKKKMLEGKLDAKRSSKLRNKSDISISNCNDPVVQFSAFSIPETEAYNPGNSSPCFSAYSTTLPPLMEMGNFQQCCDLQFQRLILNQTQFPISSFMEVPSFGTSGCDRYSVSSSHQEASSLVPSDSNHYSISSGNGSLVKDNGFEFLYDELLNDLGFQGKFSTEVAPFLGNN